MFNLSNRYYPASTTITLLIIISMLLSILLFNIDSLLSFQMGTIQQRKVNMVNFYSLHKEIWAKKQQYCHINLNMDALVLGMPESQQKIDCQQIKLFNQIPTKKIHNNFADFIQLDNQTILQQKGFEFNWQLAYSSKPQLVWLIDTESIDISNMQIKAIIVSNNNLTIYGKGEIHGAIIINGKLTLSEEIKLKYDLDVVSQLAQQYQLNQYAQQSWRDY